MLDDLYRRDLVTNSAIRASLDTVSESGTVEGWAFYPESLAVCHVQIRLGGVVLGEDMADKFRVDLLRAGLRYGYCAFYAAIPITRPGPYPLELVDGRTGSAINHLGPKNIFVPAFVSKPGISAGNALPTYATWADQDLLAHLSCLQLDMNFELMGPEWFVDAVFRFALGRWADQAALDGYCGALRSSILTPVEVFQAVMTSQERKQQDRRLPSPTESDFPFRYDLELEMVLRADSEDPSKQT